MRTSRYSILTLCLVAALVSSCGTESEDTGSAALVLQWHITQQGQALQEEQTLRSALEVKGILTGIVTTIRVTISAGGKQLVQESFSYEDNQGTVNGIPAGTGRTFLVEALSSSSIVVYNGTAPDITIVVGQTVSVPITMSPAYTTDTYAPAAIDNLTATLVGENISLSWTATGDDAHVGTATSYDLRWSTSIIQANNFNVAANITGLSAPKAVDQIETFIAEGLIPSPTCTYHFAIKALDELNNASAISNDASVTISACVDNDGCCPTTCNPNTDLDCSAVCGDGLLTTPAESCDTAIASGQPGACPTSCDDGNPCTTDTLQNAGTCTAACIHGNVTNGTACGTPSCSGLDWSHSTCQAGACTAAAVQSCDDSEDCTNDSCVAATGCSHTDITPCCGNGVTESPETCDGNCASITCPDDGIACTSEVLTGSAGTCNVVCTHPPITPCCGNGVTESPETCDGNCPTVPTDDGNACTTDALAGSPATCDVTTVHTPISPCCGNNVVETGETCDPPGSCPTSCNDSNPCTTDAITGSSTTCDFACTHTSIPTCVVGDSCCPAGCDSSSDGDCPATSACEDNVVSPPETCDPSSSCPTSCDDSNPCTTDIMTGGSTTCDVACTHTAIISCIGGDSCCPTGCTKSTDGDCPL